MFKLGKVGPVELNRAGVGAILHGACGVSEVLQAEGSKVLGSALSRAPVVTGNYVAHMFIRTVHTDRMVVQIGNNAPYAVSVEKRHSVLTGALGEASGTRHR